MNTCTSCGIDEQTHHGATVVCVYCQATVPCRGDQSVPTVESSDWRDLATEHAEDCEWVRTNAHRLPVSSDC